MKRFAFAFVATTLIATTASAQVEDVAPVEVGSVEDAVADAVTDDVAPGPRLPNGEPVPPPDLQEDIGGWSCAIAPGLVTPLPFLFAALLLLRRRR